MRARVPASSANLGPGFDALAVALSLYLEVELVEADELSVVTEGYGAGQFDDERHLGVRVARQILGHDRFAMRVNSQIPLARGLGSSAALALAAAAAANASDPLAVAVQIDGHAENAAASFSGGLVVGTIIDGATIVEPLTLDPELRFVVVIPDEQLATAAARQVLPASVAFRDATFNLAREALLIAGLADHRRLRPEATGDRLHQRYRAALLPFADDMLGALVDAGALASCWSGAGSTLLGIACAEDAEIVATAARASMAIFSVPGEVRVLDADQDGLVVS